MNGNWNDTLREKRMGICLHYDASASDKGAIQWLTKDPRCQVSYNWLVLDSGEIVSIAPAEARAWHAGVCRPSTSKLPYKDANSALYGICIAARDGEHATEPQIESVVGLCRSIFAANHWPLEESWRIVGHHTEAWPRGRKVDPVGSKPSDPVLSVTEARSRLRSPSWLQQVKDALLGMLTG